MVDEVRQFHQLLTLYNLAQPSVCMQIQLKKLAILICYDKLHTSLRLVPS